MPRIISCLLVVLMFFFTGCTKNETPVVEIDNIKISRNELLKAYHMSRYSQDDNAQLNDFLEEYISKKVILREAERLGLDKDPELLLSIQNYWEQELLKLMLTRQNAILTSTQPITDDAVREYFLQNKDRVFSGKSLIEVGPQIREFLARERQKDALQDWVEGLKKKTRIKVDDQLLNALE